MAKNIRLAIILTIITALGFSVVIAISKILTSTTVTQRTFYMNLFATITLYFVIVIRKEKIIEHIKSNIFVLSSRSLFGLISTYCLFYSLSGLSLADANLLSLTSPFFTIIFSSLILKEKQNKSTVIAVIIALIGVIFILKPSFDYSILPGISGVFAGLTSGLAYVLIRKLKNSVPPLIIAFYFCLFSTVVSLPITLLENSFLTNKQDILLFLVMGTIIGISQLLISFAYKLYEVSKLSIFLYTQMIFSLIIGAIIWNEFPDILSIIGIIVILSAATLNYYSFNKNTE